MISRRFAAVAGAVLTAFLLISGVSCLKPKAPEGEEGSSPSGRRISALDNIITRGTVRVGLNAGYMPFEMKTKTGDFIGFDVELAQEMAKRMGVKLEIVNMAWDGLIPALDTDRFDVIISGMTRTLERAKKVNFSDPYFVTGQVLMLNREAAKGVRSYADLDDSKWTVSVVLGTTGDFAAKKYMPKAGLRRFEKESEASLEVVRGKAHAFVFDEPYIRMYAKQNPEHVRTILEPFTYEPICFAVRKGDQDFLNWLNLFIEDVKHDAPVQSTYDRLYDKYFVSMSWLDESSGLTLP
jgi:polar amino acid transport system substrate-binding protein